MKEIITINNDEGKLREKSKKIYNDKEINIIAKEMKEVLLAHNDAIGLSAPQIGINKRIIMFKEYEFCEDTKNTICKKIITLVNPTITQRYGICKTFEGCLSVPGEEFSIKRSERIFIKDKYGLYNFESISAIVVQHEIDHLNGILVSDLAEENKND